jgi:hypothetical protein
MALRTEKCRRRIRPVKMKAQSANHRMLALDVRPHKLGFAIIEDPARLLDFGVTRFDSPNAGLGRVTALIARFDPAVVVLRKIARRSTRNQPLTRDVLRLVRGQARHSSIKIALVGEQQMKISLGRNRRLTKHQAASLLSQAFPELAWKIPQPRRPWQPESWNMLIFDAMALGAGYLASKNAESLARKLANL